MNTWESVRMALRSLRANKLRAALTMLGIIIGTGAVIGLLSVGEGAQAYIEQQVQSIGSNLIFVIPGGAAQNQGPPFVGNPGVITREDAEAIRDDPYAQHVGAVAPEISHTATVTSQGESVTVQVTGTTPEYAYVRNYQPTLGSFFSEGDEAASARVAVLGPDTAIDLFGSESLAVDETIRIDGVPFTVIGVIEAKGAAAFGSRDSYALVPLSTLTKRLYGGRYVSERGTRVDLINVSAIGESSVPLAIEEITVILRDEHDVLYEEDDFTVSSQQDILGVFNEITNVLTIFLAAIAGISLLVGGIGIMNIMLVSVTERTREIGIRKAVGAKRSDILWQFLIESVVLSILGGLIGIGVGWGMAQIVQALDVFSPVVSTQAIVLAVSFSVLVGLFFGIYPARRAANLNPIDALRYE